LNHSRESGFIQNLYRHFCADIHINMRILARKKKNWAAAKAARAGQASQKSGCGGRYFEKEPHIILRRKKS